MGTNDFLITFFSSCLPPLPSRYLSLFYILFVLSKNIRVIRDIRG